MPKTCENDALLGEVFPLNRLTLLLILDGLDLDICSGVFSLSAFSGDDMFSAPDEKSMSMLFLRSLNASFSNCLGVFNEGIWERKDGWDDWRAGVDGV